MISALLALTLTVTPLSVITSASEPLVDSAPRVLVYDNMVPGETRVETLTVTNKSSGAISVLPQLEVSEEFLTELTVEFGLCDDSGANCQPLERFLKLDEKEQQKINVSVTVDESLTESFNSLQGSGQIHFTAEELVDENVNNITTSEEQKYFSELAKTGADFPKLLLFGAGGISLLGLMLLILARRRSSKTSIE